MEEGLISNQPSDSKICVFYGKHPDAALVQTILESYGIPSELRSEGVHRYLEGFLVGPGVLPHFQVRVMVSREEAPRAANLLQGWEKGFGRTTPLTKLYIYVSFAFSLAAVLLTGGPTGWMFGLLYTAILSWVLVRGYLRSKRRFPEVGVEGMFHGSSETGSVEVEAQWPLLYQGAREAGEALESVLRKRGVRFIGLEGVELKWSDRTERILVHPEDIALAEEVLSEPRAEPGFRAWLQGEHWDDGKRWVAIVISVGSVLWIVTHLNY